MPRISPTASATLSVPGTRKVGNDSRMWVVAVNKNGGHRWVPTAGAMRATPKQAVAGRAGGHDLRFSLRLTVRHPFYDVCDGPQFPDDVERGACERGGWARMDTYPSLPKDQRALVMQGLRAPSFQQHVHRLVHGALLGHESDGDDAPPPFSVDVHAKEGPTSVACLVVMRCAAGVLITPAARADFFEELEEEFKHDNGSGGGYQGYLGPEGRKERNVWRRSGGTCPWTLTFTAAADGSECRAVPRGARLVSVRRAYSYERQKPGILAKLMRATETVHDTITVQQYKGRDVHTADMTVCVNVAHA